MSRLKLPAPALAIALVALFASLGGTAVAAAVVPLAKRALVADRATQADNSKKLAGETAAQLVSRAARTPGPAATAAGLVSIKQSATSIAADTDGEFVIACDDGRKIVSGGFASDGAVFGWDSRPLNATSWGIYLDNMGTRSANVTLFAVCIA
jgi:hypothetical protein